MSEHHFAPGWHNNRFGARRRIVGTIGHGLVFYETEDGTRSFALYREWLTWLKGDAHS